MEKLRLGDDTYYFEAETFDNPTVKFVEFQVFDGATTGGCSLPYDEVRVLRDFLTKVLGE